jgi:pilus assembly protein Flp/PilA
MHSTTCLTTTGRLRSAAVAWWRDEEGVTAIEYGLLAALIVLAAMGGFTALGGSVEDLFILWSKKVEDALSNLP